MENEVKGIEQILGKEGYARLKRNEEAISRYNFYDGSNDDLNTLRKAKQELENAYYDAYKLIQEQIDKKILEENDVTRFEHQYIRIKDTNYYNDEYKYVTRIDRLNNGCRVYGPSIVVYEDDSDFHYCADNDDGRLIRYEDIDEGLIEIIDVEAWNNVVENCIKKIKARKV